MECLAKALKNAAMTVSPQNARETYLQDDPNYGPDVLRIQDIDSLPCWYGYVYTQNNSEHPLSETLSLELEGLEVDYPRDCVGQTDLNIEVLPGEDHIIVLRRSQQ